MKRIISIVLVMLMSTSVVFAGGWFSGASGWAEDELLKAVDNKIISNDDFNDVQGGYSNNISREDFAMLGVRLYKAMTGITPQKAASNTFTDTTNSDVLMANKLGIINGKGNGKFKPYDKLTRQEMAIMMKRTLDSIGTNYYKGDGVLNINDKKSVSSWATQGVDFAYDNGFMKGDGVNFRPLDNTTVEQAVIIVNRVFEKYYEEPKKENDYTQGYKLTIKDNDLYITYNNTSNKVCIVKNVIKADYSKTDKSKVYYVGTNGFIYKYSLSGKYPTYIKNTKNATDFVLVESGKYAGHMIYKGTTYKVIKLNDDYNAAYVGDVESMDDPNYEIGALYEQIESDKYKFTIDVTNAINFKGETKWDEDDMIFYSSASHYDYIDNKVGYLRMYPYKYDDNAYDGPIGRIGPDRNTQLAYNGYGGFYEVDMKFNNERGNGGIVFNLGNTQDKNDNYTGYYVGLSPENNSVMLGKSRWSWTKLKEVSLGYDLRKNDTVRLKVLKNGSEISVYVDGKEYIRISDDTYMNDGGFGIRTWNCDVTYSNYTVTPLPY